MPDTPPKTVRWIETEETPPQGFNNVVRARSRVVEGTEPPESAKVTQKAATEWSEWETKKEAA